MTEYTGERVVTQTLTLTSEDFADIVDAAGYGINYWASSAVVGDDTYTATDGEDEGPPVEITPAILIQAFFDLAFGSPAGLHPESCALVRNAISNVPFDAGEIDSVMADWLIQWAAFGEVKYG